MAAAADRCCGENELDEEDDEDEEEIFLSVWREAGKMLVLELSRLEDGEDESKWPGEL